MTNLTNTQRAALALLATAGELPSSGAGINRNTVHSLKEKGLIEYTGATTMPGGGNYLIRLTEAGKACS